MLLSVFIVYRTLCATRGREVRRCPTVSAKTLYTDNYIAPALFFKVAKRGCLLRLFFYWGKLTLATLLDL